MENKYFTYKNNIIRSKISSDASNKTLSELNTIVDTFNSIMPEGTQVVVNKMELCFYDGFDYYPLEDGFDTSIY
jgi:hypothetical protein